MHRITTRVTLATLLAAAITATPAFARTLNPEVAEDAVEISKRVQCGEADGKTAVYHWAGNIYGRVPGEPDRLLFKGEGMNVRRCVSIEDPIRGKGYRMVSREVMLLLDPETGEVLREWKNPWTGETVEVMHIHNDPVNSRPTFPKGADGTPYRIASLRFDGPWAFMPFEVPLFYRNPLGGDYQEYVGNMYHAMEIFDFVALKSQLLDTSAPTAYPVISWVRVSQWAPWMKMGGRHGQMVFNAVGRKLPGGFEQLPKVLKDEIRTNYPIYTDAPPADDNRPNETTWSKFKKLMDARRAASKEKSAASGH